MICTMKKYRIEPRQTVKLRDFDPDDTSLAPGDKDETKEKSAKIVERLDAFQELLYAEHKHKVLIVLQGMDTSGKDGAIEHVMAGAGIDLDQFGSTLFIDKHAQEYPAFFAFTPGAIRVMRLRGFAIAGLSERRSNLCRS